jgi:hypothetical protein
MAFKLSAGLGLFLLLLLGGDEDTEGPNVNDRDNDEENTAPKLEPDLELECCSGDSDNGKLCN